MTTQDKVNVIDNIVDDYETLRNSYLIKDNNGKFIKIIKESEILNFIESIIDSGNTNVYGAIDTWNMIDSYNEYRRMFAMSEDKYMSIAEYIRNCIHETTEAFLTTNYIIVPFTH